MLGILIFVAVLMFGVASVQAHWEMQADELPAWGQRGRLLWSYHDNNATPPEFAKWKLVTHLHGARSVPGTTVKKRVEMGVPINLRLEAVMFFGDDSLVERQKKRYRGRRVRFDHDWYWHFNWFARDPKFREAATILRDGKQMIEYITNQISKREMGNPLSPMLLRMRSEQSMAVLTPHDPKSMKNFIYPHMPYTPEDDDFSWGKKGKPYDIYPCFGYLSSVWYDNPQMWADNSELSQKIWKKHFKAKFGVEIADPASHPNSLVRREWRRFWADAYGKYWEKYHSFFQENIKNASPKVVQLTTALNGKRVCPVMLNASKMAHIWGANQIYVFNRYKAFDYPGVQCEYPTTFTYGKFSFPIKFAMASMHGRPTGKHVTNPQGEGEALALNGTHSYVRMRRGTRAYHYAAFQYDNGPLLVNAMPGNRIGVLHNIRSGLVSSNLINTYDLCQQLDELGLTYDALIEEDLLKKNASYLAGYAAVLIPGGEFNEKEAAGLKQYVENGGHLVLIGDVEAEQPQYMKLDSPDPKPEPWRADVPLARAFGRESFDDGQLKSGRGMVTVFEDQVVPRRRLGEALQPQVNKVFRLPDSRKGFIMANVLRQPRADDALIIGLVNYSGRPQKNVAVALPDDVKVEAAAVVSPDGYALRLKEKEGVITVPELYQYSALVIGKPEVVDAALKTVKPKLSKLVRLRESLKRAGGGRRRSPWRAQIKAESVPARMQLARLRHGSNESNTALSLDAMAPRKAGKGETVRVTMKVLLAATHGASAATLEYWRLRIVNIETGKEISTMPPGADAPIPGAPVYELKSGRKTAMPYKARRLNGKTLVSDFKIDEPGNYQLFVDYLYNVGGPAFEFTHGNAGPRVEPAFPGDRPEAGWGYPGRPLKKHYVKFKLPRMIIEVAK